MQEIKDGHVTITFDHADLVNSVEVIEWESGKSLNDIAAKQGIRIRRRYRTRYPSESSQDDEEPSRNILEKIIWDKEVEVSQALTNSFPVNH